MLRHLERVGVSRWADRDTERRLVWIFGSPRTGSTWLSNLLKADPRAIAIDEPTVGVHLATLMLDYVSVQPNAVDASRLRVNDVRADLPSYFFSRKYESVWKPKLRSMVLARFRAELSGVARARSIRDPLGIVKEPVGSQGADVLMSVLPRSRMIYLLRDGRDVIDSELDAFSPGGWVADELPGYETSDFDRIQFVNARAHAWLCRVEAVERAYRNQPSSLRRMVRYEDLVADAEPVLADLFSWLGTDIGTREVAEVVERLSFQNLPAEARGPGRFARSATPGLWRERLSAEEVEVIDRVMGAKLRELGYD
jgi:hypothetical protein